jgi:hypothetical protein
MYGFFSVFGEENTAKKKKRHKKKPKQVQVEEHEKDEEQLSDGVDSEDEESMLTHVPAWAQATPEQELINEILLSMEHTAQELKASQDALQHASCALRGLNQTIGLCHDTLFRIEAMQTKGLTREEYDEQYNHISGGCVLS